MKKTVGAIILCSISLLANNFDKGIRDYQNKNFQSALNNFEIAMNQGDGYAANNVGIMYINGQGTEANADKAYKAFEKGAERSHIDSIYNYSTLSELGVGTEVNYGKAKTFYRIAKFNNHAGSKKNLKYLNRKEQVCKEGIQNVIKKTIEASSRLSKEIKFAKAADREGIQNAFTEICVKRDLKASLGIDLNYSVADKHGVKYKFDSELYCYNWIHFLEEIKGNEELEKAFAVFISRPYKSLEKNLALASELNMKAVSLVSILENFNIANDLLMSNKFAYTIFGSGSQSEEYGFRENDFQEFLIAVVGRNYKYAKEIILDYDYNKVIKQAEKNCKTF